MKKRTIHFEGVDFDVPMNYRTLGYTHGVFGVHEYRGPMCLRWQKRDVPNDRILMQISNLYGTAITNIRFIAIDTPDGPSTSMQLQKAA